MRLATKLSIFLSTLTLGVAEFPAAEMDENTITRTLPEASFPEFSWDRIPLYMHIRKDDSFSPEEIAFIAKFPLITFEKANGFRSHGDNETGTLAAARAVKKINPKAKILYYRNVIVHYGRYDANAGLEAIPNHFLRSAAGETKLIRGRVEAYDLSSPAVRDWWVGSCRKLTADSAIDGVFLDGNVKALEPNFLRRAVGNKKKGEVSEGYHLMMLQLREAIGPDELMIANILRARFDRAGLEYLDYFDGSYLENVFHRVGKMSDADYLAKGIDAIRQTGKQGKIIAFTAGLNSGSSSDMGIDERSVAADSDLAARDALTYRLAVFLIAAGKYSYFRVHEGYSANENKSWMRWFAEYDRPLGPPKGPAVKNGYRYTREFEHAGVQLDVKQQTASITWR